jgi:HAE1 family hydrophobic/amphiphilic exporter-1
MQAEALNVSFNWPQGTRIEMIEKIVRPAEEIFRSIKGIERIRASVWDTGSRFMLQMDSDAKVQDISKLVIQDLDDHHHRFPQEMRRPNVYFGSMDDLPILWLFFSAGKLETSEFRRSLIENILPEIMKVEGVGKVEHFLDERGAIEIVMDPEVSNSSNTNYDQLMGHLRAAEPQNIYLNDQTQHGDAFVKLRSEDLDSSNMGKISAGDSHQLDEVANIYKGLYSNENRNLVAGTEGEFIQISPSADANSYKVSKLACEKILELCHEYGVQSQILLATHLLIDSAFQELMNSALIGGIGALIILLIFLKQWRLAFMVTISLPVSLGASMISQNLMGQDISMFTLIGYILAVGIVVDNSIVIGEALVDRAGFSDFNKRTEGIKNVLKDLFLPIAVSTLTTLAIFTPLFLIDMPGGLKTLMFSIGMPIFWCLIGSLVLALVILPVMFLYLYPNGIQQKDDAGWAKKLKSSYEKLLLWIFRHTWISLTLCLTLLITGPFLMYRKMSSGDIDSGQSIDMRILNFNIRVRKKLELDTIEKDLRVWHKKLEQHKEELDIQNISFSYSEWGCRAILSLKPFDSKGRKPEDIKSEIAKILSPTLNIAMDEHFYSDIEDKKDKNKKGKTFGNGQPGKKRYHGKKGRPSGSNDPNSKTQDIWLMVMGQNVQDLENNWNKLVPHLEDLEGVTQIGNEEEDRGAVVLRLKEESRNLGFSTAALAEQLKFFTSSQMIMLLDQKWDLRIGVARDAPLTLNSLMSLKVKNNQGVEFPLEQLVTRSSGLPDHRLSRINSMNYKRFKFTAQKNNVKDIRKQLPDLVAKTDMKWGYDIGFDLDHKDSKNEINSGYFMIFVSILLIYFIMGVLYESFLSPVAVMMTVPLTLLAVFSWIVTFDISMSVMVILGLLFLSGVVVNNGIVLVDRLSKDMPMRNIRSNPECWKILAQSASMRFMPVILTSLTTICGGIAMASGQSKIMGMSVSELGITMTIGMCGATLFTLFVVPLVYVYLASIAHFFRWICLDKKLFIPNLFRRVHLA